ncbi:MAG: dihydroorotase [Puniceicoccales bacterium]|jgi:dihydroorotase|nr:dihydroorotase [Puniceicoccales bacterium]
MSSGCLWIKNGRVIDPASRRDARGDVFARDGVLVEALSQREREGAVVLDAGGLVVAPGFVDLHTRLGEPGNRARETFATASRAAAAGGFTTVVSMPDTCPPADNEGVVSLIKATARQSSVVRVLPAGAITLGLKGEHLAPIGSLRAAGVVAITDGIHGVQNNEIMRRALEYARMFGLVVLDHCQDSSMTRGAVMHEGVCSVRLGLRGFPAAAEEIVVASDILLSNLTRARVHLQHLTCAGAVSLVRDAKRRGIPVTAEVTAEHLLLTEEALCGYDTNLKLAAPLRSAADRAALIEAVRDGTLDAIVSDHSPVTPTEKDREFDYAPFGAIGLETSFSAALEALVHAPPAADGLSPAPAPLPLSLVVEKFTSSPARVLGLEAGTLAAGRPADIVLFDPDKTWVPGAAGFASRSCNCALSGRPLRGRVEFTLVGGKIVHAAPGRPAASKLESKE